MAIATTDLAAEIKAAINLQEEFRADGSELIQTGSDWKCNCPFHGEDTPSCKVDAEYFKCFGCDAKGDALNYLAWVLYKKPKVDGAEFVEVLREGCRRTGIEFPEKTSTAKPKEPPKVYTLEKLKQCCEWQANEHQEKVTEYNESTNPETGAVEFIEVRIEHKTKKRANGKPSKRFLQCAAVEKGFIFGLAENKKTPLFNRTRVKENAIIVLVEGAKCMRFLHTIGIVACAAAGGSNNPVANVDWSPLAGKTVLIWPDNDKGGIEFASEVRIELEKIGCVVSVVEIETLNLEPKDDVVDFCGRIQGTPEEIKIEVEKVLSACQAETIEQQIAADIDGTRYAIRHRCFMALSSTLCFLPGTITMLCANPGVSKSLLVLQWIWEMYFDGIDCSLLALESGNVFHERRALAQMCGNNLVLNPDWCKNNIHAMSEIINTFRHNIDTIRREKVIQCPRDGAEVNPDYLLSHIATEAKRGRKIIAIDPITMMETGPNFWEEQKKFVRDVKQIVRKTQVRLILVTHPKKGAIGPHLDNAAGAVAFSQNTDTFLWLDAHDVLFQQVGNPANPMETQNVKYNRTMKLLKHRLGPAPKSEIGFYMNGETLKHEEVGFVETV